MNCHTKNKTRPLVIASVVRLRSVGRAVGQLTFACEAWADSVSDGFALLLRKLADWRASKWRTMCYICNNPFVIDYFTLVTLIIRNESTLNCLFGVNACKKNSAGPYLINKNFFLCLQVITA